jgi:hypothetical protein
MHLNLEVSGMKKVLIFIVVALFTVAMSATVLAGCGCGGGKLKTDPNSEVLTKA